ncbi:MAG: hypothetical protein ACR2GB_05580 [Nocardioidaceae bacterium]
MTAGDPENRIAVDGENAPENFADQLELYDAINRVGLAWGPDPTGSVATKKPSLRQDPT